MIEAAKEYAALMQNLRTLRRGQIAASLTRGDGVLARITEVGPHETHLEADIIVISKRRKGERRCIHLTDQFNRLPGAQKRDPGATGALGREQDKAHSSGAHLVVDQQQFSKTLKLQPKQLDSILQKELQKKNSTPKQHVNEDIQGPMRDLFNQKAKGSKSPQSSGSPQKEAHHKTLHGLANEVLHDVLSDGEADLRPASLRQFRHLKMFCRRQISDEEAKVARVERVVFQTQTESLLDQRAEFFFAEKLERLRGARAGQTQRQRSPPRLDEAEDMGQEVSIIIRPSIIRAVYHSAGDGTTLFSVKEAAEERDLINNSRRKKSTFSPVVRRPIILRNACHSLERHQIFETYDFELLSRPIYLLDRVTDGYETEQDWEFAAPVEAVPAIEQEDDDGRHPADIEAFSEAGEPAPHSNVTAISDIPVDQWAEELDDFPSPRLNNALAEDKFGEGNHVPAKGSSRRGGPAMKRTLTTVPEAGPGDSFEFTLNQRSSGGRRGTLRPATNLAHLRQIDDDFTRELSDGERELREHKKNAETLKRNLQRRAVKAALARRKVNFAKVDEELAGLPEGEDRLRKLKMIGKVPGQRGELKRKTSARRAAGGNKGSQGAGSTEGPGKKSASTAARDAEPMVLKEWNKSKKAIEDNQLQVISNFVHFNAQDIDLRDEEGYTLLALAVHYGRVEMVETLLKNGASPNIATEEEFGKNSPLHLAVNFKFKKICDLLIDAGAEESAQNNAGLVPWEGVVQM